MVTGFFQLKMAATLGNPAPQKNIDTLSLTF